MFKFAYEFLMILACLCVVVILAGVALDIAIGVSQEISKIQAHGTYP